jgi:hypothetical protein
MLEAMARIAPSQPNEAMVRIAPRRNGTTSLDPSCRVKIPEQGSLDVDSKFFSKVQIDLKGDWARLFQKGGSSPPVSHEPKSTIFCLAQQRFLLDPPCSVASFEVNSEPHTPSVRLCVGLKMQTRFSKTSFKRKNTSNKNLQLLLMRNAECGNTLRTTFF